MTVVPDPSVVHAALTAWDPAHERAVSALEDTQPRLCLVVAFAVTAQLTAGTNATPIAPELVLKALSDSYPDPWLQLTPTQTQAALTLAVEAGLRGPAINDALVAATAAQHQATVLTLRSEAQATSKALGVPVRLLPDR